MFEKARDSERLGPLSINRAGDGFHDSGELSHNLPQASGTPGDSDHIDGFAEDLRAG
jgi:hypothetical protein